MFSLKVPTPKAWLETVLNDFDTFLLDHAACERKASAVGLSFVVRYPDRTHLIDPLIAFAREELEHFHAVYRVIQRRGLLLPPDTQDEYVNRLMKLVRTGAETRLLDRLIVASVIEARGHERLALVAEAMEDPELKALYDRLAKAEGGHQNLFVRLAEHYFSPETISQRLNTFLENEAEIVSSLPLRPVVH